MRPHKYFGYIVESIVSAAICSDVFWLMPVVVLIGILMGILEGL